MTRDEIIEAVKKNVPLRGADLSGVDLRDADLRGADLSGVHRGNVRMMVPCSARCVIRWLLGDLIQTVVPCSATVREWLITGEL